MKKIMLILFVSMMSAAYAGGQTVGSRTETFEHLVIRAGVSADDAQALALSMRQAGFTTTQMEQLAKQMSGDSFPAIARKAVYEKVLEGVAKKIAPERILQATTKVENRYRFAMELTSEVETNSRERLVEDYADSLAAGLTREDASRIASAIEDSGHQEDTASRVNLRQETLLAAREMVRQGVSSATTASVIEKAISHGYNGENMHLLRLTLRSRQRANIEETAQMFGDAISRGISADQLNSINGGGGSNFGQVSESGRGHSSSPGGSGSDGGHGGSSNGGGNGNGGGGGGGGNGSGGGGGSGNGNGGGRR